MMFAGVDYERVELIEELMVGGQGRFEEIADFVVGEFGMSMAVAFEDAARVGIDDENRMLTGVEKNGIGGFRADAAQGEQLLAKKWSGGGEHFREGAAVGFEEKVYEGFESFGFLAEIAGRAQQPRNPRGMNTAYSVRCEDASSAQIANGALDVGPRSVLGEDGTDDDFKAGTARPPVLGAVGGEKCFEVRQERSRCV
jgi:hypothetical protein